MSWPENYGMRLRNGSGVFIVDSSEEFGHFHLLASGTLSSGSTSAWPSGVVWGDLWFVRLTGSGWVGDKATTGFGATTRYIYSTHTGSKPWVKVGNIKGNITGADLYGDYGLNIFDDSAQNSVDTVVFSSMVQQGIDIISVGQFDDIGSNTSINIPINDAGNIYVLIPGSLYHAFGTDVQMGYQYNYSGSTVTSIDVTRRRGSSPYHTNYGNQAYMIVKIRS